MSFTGQPGGEPNEGRRRAPRRDLRALRGERDPRGAARAGTHRPGRRIVVSLVRVQPGRDGEPGRQLPARRLVPGPLGNQHPNIVPYQLFEAADRPFILAAGNDRCSRGPARSSAVGPPRGRALRDERGSGPQPGRTDPRPRRGLPRSNGRRVARRPGDRRLPSSPVLRMDEVFATPEGAGMVQEVLDPVRGTLRWSPTRSVSTARCRRCAGARPTSASTRRRSCASSGSSRLRQQVPT